MEHIDSGRMIEHCLNDAPFTADELGHLVACQACAAEVARWGVLRDEMAVARASQVRPEAQEQLFAMLAEAGHVPDTAGVVKRAVREVVEWVQALPLWDSRESAAVAGVRGTPNLAYRMLFGARDTEVELMVEPTGGGLRVRGEVMVGAEQENSGLALIELLSDLSARRALETESDVEGRFALDAVPPGTYVMTVTPRFGHVLVIEHLELT